MRTGPSDNGICAASRGPVAPSLRPFQRQFLRRALAPGIDTAALSLPRGNGKSWLAAHVLTRALTPGDPLHVAGTEYLLCAASIEQARLCFRFVRSNLEATGEYRFLDSSTRIGIAHKASNTRLRVLSSNGKTAMGIVGCPLAVADEPGSWEVGGGQFDGRCADDGAGETGIVAPPHADRDAGAIDGRLVARPDRRGLDRLDARYCRVRRRRGTAGPRSAGRTR